MKKVCKHVGICLSVFVVLLSCFCLHFGGIEAKADYGTKYGLTDKQLFNATNTYSVKEEYLDENGQTVPYFNENGEYVWRTDTAYEEEKQYPIEYDMDAKNATPVMEKAQITVLTHGLGGNAGHWSNHFSEENKTDTFAYDDQSLIAQIDELAGGVNIYWAQLYDYDKFWLFDITNERSTATAYATDEYTPPVVRNITDISKHIVVVYDASNCYASNANEYYGFNYMLSKIVYDVKLLNGGKLPKINLIGHSRGGLTNLQYALDHPDLVSTLISIGTPYFGSTTANLAGDAFMEKESKDGLNDIVDPGVYKSYNTRWNNNYDKLYKDIRVYAHGSYHTLHSLAEAIVQDYSGYFGTAAKTGIAAAIYTVNALKACTFLGGGIITNAVMKKEVEVLSTYFPKSKVVDAAEIVTKELVLDKHPSFVAWENDVLVPLDSQLGENNGTKKSGALTYKGFNRKTRVFVGDDADYTKVSMGYMPPVAHNLEARDSKIIRDILKEIEIGVGTNNDYVTWHKNDGTAILADYRGTYEATNFVIPSAVNGETIVEIAPYAFADCEFADKIQTIMLPSTVKKIGAYAFSNFTALTSVQYSGSASIEEIGAGAFHGCTSLTTFTLPYSLRYLSPYTFIGCTALKTVHAGNSYYSSINGVVYSKDKAMLVYYPEGKADEAYDVDTNCTEVGQYAFRGNQYLKTVHLHNVRMLRKGSFYQCNALENIDAESLAYVEVAAISDTKWANEQTGDMIALGDVLIAYRGDDATVLIENMAAVAPYAFAGNESIQTVTVDNTLRDIGENAFYGCENLDRVNIKNNGELVYIDVDMFGGTNATIYVPQTIREAYAENELWQPYNDAIEVLSTRVHFDSNGGSAVPDGTVYYASPVGSLPTPTRAQYRFLGWKYGDETVETASYWLHIDSDVTFVADWKPIEYNIALHTNGGAIEEDFEGLYTSQAGKALPTPVRTGYIFQGWCENADLTDDPIFSIPAGATGDKTYYAKWEAKGYYLTLTYGYEGSPEDIHVSYKVYYDSEFTLPLPQTREGYIFNGWKYGKTLYTNEQGISTKRWDIDEDATLEADWTIKTFEIQIVKKVKDGKESEVIVWLTKDGYTDKGTCIEYGTEFSSSEELEKAFNVDKVSLKPGHKFKYFTIDGETRFTIWSVLPDLGENGSIFQIEVYFEKEEDFSLVYVGEVSDGIVNPLTANFGDEITLLEKTKPGYVFEGWYITDNERNREHFPLNGEKTQLYIGAKFDYVRMPDLSYNREEDGVDLYLEPRFRPIEVTISYVTYSDEKIADTEYVQYGSLLRLPIPNAKRGYEFVGWYFGELGAGEQCTDKTGQMLHDWDKVVNVTLYARYDAIIYTITYELNGGKWDPFPASEVPTEYSILDPTEGSFIPLTEPSKQGYRFMGWYLDASLSGVRLVGIPANTIGDLTIYAKWEKEYKLQFREGHSIAYEPYYAIFGEKVILPSPLPIAHYDKGEWVQSQGNTYPFGATYTVSSDVVFTLHWIPIEYYINYVMFDNILSAPASQSKYTVEYIPTFWTPTAPTPLKKGDKDPPETTYFQFDGWYSDVEFKHSVDYVSFKKISGYADGTVSLYGRWKFIRQEKYTITDSGTLKQSYDNMTFEQLTGMSLATLRAKGYTSITFTGAINVWQKYDGTKHMRYYDGPDATEAASSWWINHCSGKSDVVYFLSDYGTWTIDLANLESETILFRYSASGKFEDTWYNNNLWIAVASLS